MNAPPNPDAPAQVAKPLSRIVLGVTGGIAAYKSAELVRLLVYLQEPSLSEQMVEQLKSDVPSVEKMQILMHAPFLHAGWTIPRKLELLKAYEDARTIVGGKSFAGYIENVSREFFATFNEEERQLVLADGAKWPTSALSVLAKLPEHPRAETLVQIQRLHSLDNRRA